MIADLQGRVFNRLTVTGPCVRGDRGVDVFWPVRCACGTKKRARHYDLLSGDAQSCGCHKRDSSRRRMTTHGNASRDAKRRGYSPEYRCWMAMRSRCNNPKTEFYYCYGGRGIRVDPRWDNFAVFLRDMGPKPGPHFTIERERVDENYCPENCFWLHRSKQANNTRRSRLLQCRGRTQSLIDWARESGRPQGTIWQRLQRGWSTERAIFEAPHW
jgi:hypothetical protein